eukprot:1156749-Pelagomonas_calceolata.AAC.1
MPGGRPYRLTLFFIPFCVPGGGGGAPVHGGRLHLCNTAHAPTYLCTALNRVGGAPALGGGPHLCSRPLSRVHQAAAAAAAAPEPAAATAAAACQHHGQPGFSQVGTGGLGDAGKNLGRGLKNTLLRSMLPSWAAQFLPNRQRRGGQCRESFRKDT